MARNRHDDAEKATTTIFLYVGERAERHIRDLCDPVEIWKRLKEVYELRRFSACFYLWQKLFTVRIADHRQGTKATESYIDSCRSICEQLRESGATVSNEIEASALLNGLYDAFETFVVTTTQSFRSNGKTDEVNVEDLISQLIDEDRCHTAKNRQKPPASGTYGLIAQKKRQRIECEHCHRTGHTKGKCWNLHPELRPAPSKAAASYAMSGRLCFWRPVGMPMIFLFPAPGGHANGLFCFRRPVGKPMVSLFPAPGGHADGLCSRHLPVVGSPMIVLSAYLWWAVR